MLKTFGAAAGAAIIAVSSFASAPAEAGGRNRHFNHVTVRVVHPGFFGGNQCFRKKVFVKHHGFRKVLICR